MLPALEAIETAAVPFAVMVNVIALEVAVVVDKHDALEVSTQVITSLLANVVLL